MAAPRYGSAGRTRWSAIRCEDGTDYAGSKISVYALSDSKDKNDAFGVTGGGNVVEIICQSKQVRVYAEYIEGMVTLYDGCSFRNAYQWNGLQFSV